MVVANSYHYILLFGEDLVQCVVQNGIYVVWSSARYFSMIRSSEIWSFFYKCPRPNPLVASFLRLLSSKLHLLTFQRPESPPEFIWRTLVDLSPLLMIIVPDRFPSLCLGLSYFHSCSALNALSSGIPVFGSIVMLSPSILFRMPLCGATVFQ